MLNFYSSLFFTDNKKWYETYLKMSRLHAWVILFCNWITFMSFTNCFISLFFISLLLCRGTFGIGCYCESTTEKYNIFTVHNFRFFSFLRVWISVSKIRCSFCLYAKSFYMKQNNGWEKSLFSWFLKEIKCSYMYLREQIFHVFPEKRKC